MIGSNDKRAFRNVCCPESPRKTNRVDMIRPQARPNHTTKENAARKGKKESAVSLEVHPAVMYQFPNSTQHTRHHHPDDEADSDGSRLVTGHWSILPGGGSVAGGR